MRIFLPIICEIQIDSGLQQHNKISYSELYILHNCNVSLYIYSLPAPLEFTDK